MRRILLLPRPAPDRLGIAPGRLVAGQVVRGIEPGELLSREDVSRRASAFRIAQRAGQQMDFIRNALVLISERRSAARTESAPHAGRGGKVGRRSRGETERVARYRDTGGH